MSQHTPGLLKLFGFDLYFANNAGGFSLRGCPSPEENARRIAACWNLLAPFTTGEIEQGIDLVSLVRQRDEALQERQREHALRVRLAGELETANQQCDELLAALGRIATYPETREQELGVAAIRAIASVAITMAKAAQAGEGV